MICTFQFIFFEDQRVTETIHPEALVGTTTQTELLVTNTHPTQL